MLDCLRTLVKENIHYMLSTGVAIADLITQNLIWDGLSPRT